MSQPPDRVLVVASDEDHRKSIASMLEAAGHEVTAVGTSQEAWDLGKREPAGILVVDWRLPDDLDGLRLSDRLRRIDPTIKTILLADEISSELRESARSSRIASLQEKPIDPDHLTKTVTELVALRARLLGPCVGCRFRLPLLDPASEEEAGLWRCGICHQHYRAEFDPTFPEELHSYVERVS